MIIVSTSNPNIQSWLWYYGNICNNIKFSSWVKFDYEFRCKEDVFYLDDGASMFSETLILLYEITLHHILDTCKPSKQQASNNAICLMLVACFFNLSP
jgi:hypothetical protein